MKIYKTGMVGFGFIGKVHAYGHMNIPLFYDQQEFNHARLHLEDLHCGKGCGAGRSGTRGHRLP